MGAAMHTIFKDFTFAAAHAIRGHTRGCQNLHGHNYRVRVHLKAERLDELGMDSPAAAQIAREKLSALYEQEAYLRDRRIRPVPARRRQPHRFPDRRPRSRRP